MPLNILFSLALIRLSRPSALSLLQRYGWVAFSVLIPGLLLVLPFAGDLFDYGAEGWLWALFGLCQRMYVDGRSFSSLDDALERSELTGQGMKQNWRLIRLPACLITAVVYVWQEQVEFEFSDFQFIVVAVGVAILSCVLSLFVRGPSRLQPPQAVAVPLRWLGRHTLEIYVIQLAGSELIINLIPGLAA